MIVGIGIDTTDIARFVPWTQFTTEQLQKVYSLAEIDYCRSIPVKMAERLAGRFAAREAFYKAFTQMMPHHDMPLLTVSKHLTINPVFNGSSEPVIDWHTLLKDHNVIWPISSLHTHLSITHTPTIATALLVIESR